MFQVTTEPRLTSDYILFRSELQKLIKVIPNDECMPQHRLLACTFRISISPKPKRKFTARLLTWKISRLSLTRSVVMKGLNCRLNQLRKSGSDRFKSTVSSMLLSVYVVKSKIIT